MPSWAVVIALGPVDGFITSGRRSRDLWWGSTWVSVCTLRTARALKELAEKNGAAIELVVPTEDRVRELAPDKKLGRIAFGGRVSNFIEAEIEAPNEEAVRALLRDVESGARQFLIRQLEHSVDQIRQHPKRKAALDEVLDSEPFQHQAKAIGEGDFLEFFAAWSPCGPEPYTKAVEKAWRLLEARKAARLFPPASWSRPGRAKSDLDPGRDSVLLSANTRDRWLDRGTAGWRHLGRRILGIGPEEELDALGLARRLAVFDPAPVLGRLPFPPLTRVALDPWLMRAWQHPEAKGVLDRVKKIIETAEDEENELFFSWCSPARDPKHEFEPLRERRMSFVFPYDASLLMEGALPALEKELERVADRLPKDGAEGELGRVRQDLDAARRHLAALREPVADLHRILGVPPPYFALLMADGDGVGERLRSLDRPGRQEMVKALDAYAGEAQKLIQRHFGCAFFVGGDDIAAYLPVDKALPALKELAAMFATEQAKLAPPKGSGADTDKPLTLSAGVVIAHSKADLRAVRRRARLAMKEAKQARRDANAAEGFVSLVELPRSGNERVATGPLASLATDLRLWGRGYQKDELSPRSSHLLKDLADRFVDDTPAGGKLGIELGRARLEAQGRRSSKQEDPAAEKGEEPEVTPRARLRERLSGAAMQDWRGAEHLAAELAIAVRVQRVAALRGEEVNDGDRG